MSGNTLSAPCHCLEYHHGPWKTTSMVTWHSRDELDNGKKPLETAVRTTCAKEHSISCWEGWVLQWDTKSHPEQWEMGPSNTATLARAAWLVNTRGSTNHQAGQVQLKLPHAVGDRAPTVHMKDTIRKIVWAGPALSIGTHGTAFAQGPL